MAVEHHRSSLVPLAPWHQRRLDRRQKRDRLKAMLQAYWASLIAESETKRRLRMGSGVGFLRLAASYTRDIETAAVE